MRWTGEENCYPCCHPLSLLTLTSCPCPPPPQVHLRDKPVSHDIDYKELALMTSGMSGAQVGRDLDLDPDLTRRGGLKRR